MHELMKIKELLKNLSFQIWLRDIPSPGTCPEYVEHHKSIQEILKLTDEVISNVDDIIDATTLWILCKDTLPGTTGAYLVACTNGNVKVGHFSTFDNKWTDAKAVAWMPLPEWEGE